MTDDLSDRINTLAQSVGDLVVASDELPQVMFIAVVHVAVVQAKYSTLTKEQFLQYVAGAYDMTHREETLQ